MKEKLGIQARVWLSISSLGVGYIALLLFGQWVGYRISNQSSVASTTLFPAALKSQQAEAAFQRILKRYGDAVMLLDKKSMKDADEDVQTAHRWAPSGRCPGCHWGGNRKLRVCRRAFRI